MSLPTIFIYSLLLKHTIISFPKTFTLGEAMIVVQGIVLFIFMMIANIAVGDRKNITFSEVTIYVSFSFQH